jgi:LPS sulfotransferase NodH
MPNPDLRNFHREELICEFGSLAPRFDFIPPRINYLLVLFTNRCGSNFLSQILASTGWFNEAGEFFNAETVREHARAQKLGSLQEYFSFLVKLVSQNGWIASKLTVDGLEVLAEAGILTGILQQSHFILIERQNKIAQAVSRVIAAQNQSWTSEQIKRVSDDHLEYSRSRIQDELGQIELETAWLYRFLRDVGAAPSHIAYEALVTTPQAHLDELTARLQLPKLTYDPTRVRIARQANTINRSWIEAFTANH